MKININVIKNIIGWKINSHRIIKIRSIINRIINVVPGTTHFILNDR